MGSQSAEKTASIGDAKTLLGRLLVLVIPPVVYFLALQNRFSVQASIFAALLSATILLWVFSLVEEFVGPLVAVVGTPFVGLAPPEVALGGFASPTLLLLVGVFALSAAVCSRRYRFAIENRRFVYGKKRATRSRSATSEPGDSQSGTRARSDCRRPALEHCCQRHGDKA